MRIAYMLTSLGIGGAERQALSIAERMAKRGHEVMVIVLRGCEAREWATRVRVERLAMTRSPFALARGVVRARRIMREFEPDIVHSHTCPANIAARILCGLRASPAVISTIHNVYEGGWHRTLAYRFTNRLAAHTTAVSHAVADRYLSTGAVAANRCSVLTNGIDVSQFSSQRNKAATAALFPETNGDFVWLAAGRDVPAKDFDTLLAAFAIARVAFPRMQLWIAGEARANRMNVSGRGPNGRKGPSGVCWLGVRSDMPDTIGACDAFVLSSAWEGMPLVVGEAMAMKKPVVATDVGGVRELLGDAGVLVPPRNPIHLAAAMSRAMNASVQTRQEWGRAARERICQRFNMDGKAVEWESLYLRILGDNLPLS